MINCKLFFNFNFYLILINFKSFIWRKNENENLFLDDVKTLVKKKF